MRDLTEALPKPMLKVRGKPVLQHIIEGLRDNGLTSLLIVVGWRADVVKQFLGDGSKLGVHIVHPRDGRIIPFDTYNLFYRDEKERMLEKVRHAEHLVPISVAGTAIA